jgi:hypothetical protein
VLPDEPPVGAVPPLEVPAAPPVSDSPGVPDSAASPHAASNASETTPAPRRKSPKTCDGVGRLDMALTVNDRSLPAPLRKCATGVVAIAVAVGASLFSVAAAAQSVGSLRIELGWEAPPSCPPSDDIERDVRRLLGDAPIPDTLPTIVARVSVRENLNGTFEVRVRTTSGGEERERELRTETCEEARHLVAFLLAFLVDPHAQERAGSDAPPTEKTTTPATRAPAAPERPRAPSRPARTERYPRWVATVLVGAELGVLPSVSLGGELRAGLLFSGWSLEGRAAAWLPRRAESSSLAGAGGEFTLLDAGILGCLRSAPWEAPSIQLCAGPVLLSLRGEGYGVQTPAHDEALFAGAAAEGALLIAISPHLSLRPALGALVPFDRPTFAIRAVGPIHRPSAAAARASLGFEVKF